MAGHTEHAFESAIKHGLITGDRYQTRAPDAFDPATALFPDDVIGFIRDSQPARWGQLEAMLKDRTAGMVIDSLTKELASKGALGVLRHGFKCYGKELRLAWFQPNSGMNPESAARYAANRLTIPPPARIPSHRAETPRRHAAHLHHRRGAERQRAAGRHRGAEKAALKPARHGRPQTGHDRPRRPRSVLPVQETHAGAFRRRSRPGLHDHKLTGKRPFPALQPGRRLGRGQPAGPRATKDRLPVGGGLAARQPARHLARFMHLEVIEKGGTAGRRCGRRTMIFPRYHQLDSVRKLGSARQGREGREQLPDHALGRQRQEQLHRLAGAPALQPARRRGPEGIRLGRGRHRPPRARPAVAEHDLPVRAQVRAWSRRSTRTRRNWPRP